MPGPKATNRTSRPDNGSTDKKARDRIESRQATVPTSQTGAYHKPGSENRKKS